MILSAQNHIASSYACCFAFHAFTHLPLTQLSRCLLSLTCHYHYVCVFVQRYVKCVYGCDSHFSLSLSQIRYGKGVCVSSMHTHTHIHTPDTSKVIALLSLLPIPFHYPSTPPPAYSNIHGPFASQAFPVRHQTQLQGGYKQKILQKKLQGPFCFCINYIFLY